MSLVRIFDSKKSDWKKWAEKYQSRSLRILPSVEEKVRRIIRQVRRQGDRAVVEWTEKLDGVKLRPSRIRVSEEKLRGLARQADPSLVAALKAAIFNIAAFHKNQLEKSWEMEQGDVVLGQRITPLGVVGLYVPGGTAAYPSTVLMNAIPAKVAGVEHIVVCTPPKAFEQSPAVAAALWELNLRDVYLVGGAQAIAAMAYGTETIPRVHKIFGPGNIYVATAKRLVYGDVAVDLTAGPSEVIILADLNANPRFVAADMLSQAEHDAMAAAICITNSKTHAVAVAREVELQLERLSRRAIARRALKNFGAIIVVEDLYQGIALINDLAPEHVEVMCDQPESFARMIRCAGAIFHGEFSPEPVGDYFAGPNHVLPTTGTARFASPLGVYDFLKRTSIIKYSRERLEQARQAIETMALSEGLDGHANAVRIRFEGTPIIEDR
ncbi:MAG: histidinol dehydrogenase [Acidobacteria bacterium]|nr:histidinol dehydrogenase [Acidobacteriota bacterium]